MCIGAEGEEIGKIIDNADVSALQNAADSAGVDMDIKETILSMASGKTKMSGEVLREVLAQIRDSAISGGLEVFTSVAAPMLAAVICCRICRGREMRFFSAVICTYAFLSVMSNSVTNAQTLLGQISSVTGAAFPLVSGFLAMSGSISSQALLTPMAGLVSTATADIMEKWGIYLCCAACACACACTFGKTVRLDGIFSMLKTAVTWISGGLMTFFVAILSIQGLLGRSYDSAAMRTAQYAVDRMLPVIGGGVSDSLGTVLSSINMVKTASGITGMLVLISSCALPIAKLWAVLFAIRLSAAVASPIDDAGISDAAVKFSQVVSMLMTICLTSATMSLVLLGAALASGRSV